MIEKNTELKIIEAARKVFLVRGYSGARMQDIADEAGINKAMLHYYFRNKDKLFESIFSESVNNIRDIFSQSLNSEKEIDNTLINFIATYSEFIKNNRYLPSFIINEMQQGSEMVEDLFKKNIKMYPIEFIKKLKKEQSLGTLEKYDPLQIIVSIIGLCLFPVLAQPVLKILFDYDDNKYDKFLTERVAFLQKFIIKGLKK
ncbi:MAG: TetR/AcrR family transcriptional regulator [Candidatus Kapabacteria bacterium]|nr:TetR/AcrR family transcriptional regulator [Candidatus Kapabacteria bacterium]